MIDDEEGGMELKWLGWAGVELAVGDATLVIDALDDARAVFAPLGARAAGMPVPDVVAADGGRAVAALVTHLHRDHADAAAIASALVPSAPVLEPPRPGGDAGENLALLQADGELDAAGLRRAHVDAWETAPAPPFEVTALPAVDGTGDPQVSWLVEAGGVRVLHLGDTMFHGFWWRIARRFGPFDVVLVPVNGAVLNFPHRQPPSPLAGAMTPEQAAVAVEILRPRLAVPIHADGYRLEGIYEPADSPARRFEALAAGRGVPVALPRLGVASGIRPLDAC